MKWVLVVWFATGGNYAYVPVIVGDYTEEAKCVASGKSFVRQSYTMRPGYACLKKD